MVIYIAIAIGSMLAGFLVAYMMYKPKPIVSIETAA